MINIYTLKDCSFCKETLVKLNQEGILYTNIDADENEQLVSKIERALETTIYPIVNIPTKTYPYWIISASSEGRVMRSDCSIEYYQSIPHLLILIKRIITQYAK